LKNFYLFGGNTFGSSFAIDWFSTETQYSMVSRTVRGAIKYDSGNEEK